MPGGMSGGGMGFIVDPARKAHAHERLQAIMSETKRRLQRALPFAMEPVVYDFAINERGTQSALLDAESRRAEARRQGRSLGPTCSMNAARVKNGANRQVRAVSGES
jgi:hypothetical protein